MTHEEQLISYRNIATRSKTLIAVQKGILIKPTMCSECGSEEKIYAHHNDYEDYMNVEWLCHTCHWKRHGSIDHLEADTTPYCHIKVCANNSAELNAIKEYAMNKGRKTIGELLLRESMKPLVEIANSGITKDSLNGLSEIMTIEELSKYLKVSDQTIQRAITSGKLKAFKVSRDWRIERNCVLKWIDNEEKQDKREIMIKSLPPIEVIRAEIAKRKSEISKKEDD